MAVLEEGGGSTVYWITHPKFNSPIIFIILTVTIRGANTLLLRVHVQVPLSLKEVLDIFK